MNHQRKQTGVALIVVLLIVAIITVIAVEMSGRLQLNVARTLNLKANNQAYWYALGAEQFAKSSLVTLNTLSAKNINLSQPWAETFEFPVEGGYIKAQLIDMQACFNLNAINSTPVPNPNGPTQSQRAFQTLIENFISDSLAVETIRDSLIDWIDADSKPNNYGAEDADYESLANPYLAANSPLGHPSEMRLINGIDQVIKMGGLQALRKVVCVLPNETKLKINVNTITAENAVVLSALLSETSDDGPSIIDSRPPEGFKDIADFLNLTEVLALNLDPDRQAWFDVTTKYFKLNTTAKFQGSQFKLSTIFKLDSGGISIISREFGGAF
ncbi:MAG: general secretion pathway protein K [Alphaproteobacteria bacterium]|jgi:general secretion pathway protein K